MQSSRHYLDSRVNILIVIYRVCELIKHGNSHNASGRLLIEMNRVRLDHLMDSYTMYVRCFALNFAVFYRKQTVLSLFDPLIQDKLT